MTLGLDGVVVVSEWPVVSATAGAVDVFPLSRVGLTPMDSESEDEDEEGREGGFQEEEKDEDEMCFPPGPALFCRTRAVLVDREEDDEGREDGEEEDDEERHQPLSPFKSSYSSSLSHSSLFKLASFQTSEATAPSAVAAATALTLVAAAAAAAAAAAGTPAAAAGRRSS